MKKELSKSTTHIEMENPLTNPRVLEIKRCLTGLKVETFHVVTLEATGKIFITIGVRDEFGSEKQQPLLKLLYECGFVSEDFKNGVVTWIVTIPLSQPGYLSSAPLSPVIFHTASNLTASNLTASNLTEK